MYSFGSFNVFNDLALWVILLSVILGLFTLLFLRFFEGGKSWMGRFCSSCGKNRWICRICSSFSLVHRNSVSFPLRSYSPLHHFSPSQNPWKITVSSGSYNVEKYQPWWSSYTVHCCEEMPLSPWRWLIQYWKSQLTLDLN